MPDASVAEEYPLEVACIRCFVAVAQHNFDRPELVALEESGAYIPDACSLVVGYWHGFAAVEGAAG